MLSTLLLLTALAQPPVNVVVNVYTAPAPAAGWLDEAGAWHATYGEALAQNIYLERIIAEVEAARAKAAADQRMTDLFIGLMNRPIAAGHAIPGRDYVNTRNTIFGRGHRVPIR